MLKFNTFYVKCFLYFISAQDDVLNDIERGLDNQKQQGLLMGSELERQKVCGYYYIFAHLMVIFFLT